MSPTVNFGTPLTFGMLFGLFESQTNLCIASYRLSIVRSHRPSSHLVGRKRLNGRSLAMSRSMPGSRSYGKPKYRCSLLPKLSPPLVSGSAVYWIGPDDLRVHLVPEVPQILVVGDEREAGIGRDGLQLGRGESEIGERRRAGAGQVDLTEKMLRRRLVGAADTPPPCPAAPLRPPSGRR